MLNIMLSVPIIFRLIASIFLFMGAAIFLMYLISYKRPFDIYLTSFGFSLAVIMTMIVSIWAYAIGAIDEHGVYQGQTGQFLSRLLNFSLGLSEEIWLIILSLVLLIIPQIMSYVISGFFGSASNPLFVREGIEIGFWFMVKSFPTVAGILMGLTLVGGFLKWPHFDDIGISRLVLLSSVLIFSCYLAIFIYIDFHMLISIFPLRLRNLGQRLHGWFTRRSRSPKIPGQS